VQSLFKDVGNAFNATKSFGGTAGAGQGGGSGVYSEGIHMPGFVVLLLMMALNRANPKLGRVGETGDSAVDVPIPDCFRSMLEKNVLKKAKRNKMATLKSELLSSDPKGLMSQARSALEKDFNKACKKREKMPAVSLFAKYMMSRMTLVTELKERGIIVQKNVKAKPKVTGDDAGSVELSLASLDVEAAFTLCQDGGHGDAANETIEFDEFLIALGMCGCFKYSEGGMSIPQRVEAIIGEFLGKSSAEAALEASAPKAERYDPSGSGAPPAFIAEWKKMDLQYVKGFPTWEADVFAALAEAFGDLNAIFTYYAGDSPGMQQAELVDLALDNNLPTKKYTITMIIDLFEQVNKESGAGDADLELFEFLQFLVLLAFSRNAGAGVDELKTMLLGLRRSVKIEELTPVAAELQADEAVGAAIAAMQGVLEPAFTKAAGGVAMSERSFLQFLEGCKLVRSVIVTMPGGAEGHADLTWQDASAAFQLCGGGSGLSGETFGRALAVCGATKYRDVPGLSMEQRVTGFLENVAGRKDEHDFIGAGKHTSF